MTVTLSTEDETMATENKYSRLTFGGGEAGERAAQEALVAHEATMVPGARVRIYRGQPLGVEGTIVEERGGRRYAVDAGDGLTWEIESRNLELIAANAPRS
jgi:hypothetical protein